jgi:hypothetical protein
MKPAQYVRLLLTLVLLAPLVTLAENSTTVGDYTIHHNAFTTATLTPEVAKVYGIQRSKVRGMLNVSIIKEKEGTTGESVAGTVNVSTVALTGQRAALPMREIKEQGAVYYIGEFPVHNEEKVNFIVKVTPEGAPETFLIKMEQQFFSN